MTDDQMDSDGWHLPGYRVGALIGRGGFSAVYEARQISLNRSVAVKVLLTDLASEPDRRRFEREREILARLSEHPCIVDVYDAGISAERRPFIVMRLYRGGTLAQRIARSGPLDVAEVVGIVERLATGLDAAHALNILHRDVKPENALVTDDGLAVLSDFGIATLVDAQNMTHRTHSSTGFFTLAHVAPEVLERAEFSVASDVYALASTAYMLLAGRPPFDVRNPRVASMILDDPPVPIDRPDLPPAVWDVLRQAMAKQPADRPASAGAFSRALSQAWSSATAAPADAAPADAAPADAATTAAEADTSTNAPASPETADRTAEQPTLLGWPSPDRPILREALVEIGSEQRTVVRDWVPPRPPGGALAGSRPGRSRGRVALAAGLALALVAVVGVGGYLWSQSHYSVGAQNGRVALYRGVGAHFLGVNLRSARVTDVEVELLPDDDRAEVRRGVELGSGAEANRMLSTLKARAATCASSLRPPCPARPVHLPGVLATMSTFPHGNVVTITWTDPDRRDGAITQLQVNGGGPSAACPTVITESGQCSFGGSWARTYVVAATATAPGQAQVIGPQSQVTTYPAPSLTVTPGEKFTDKGATYCTVLVSATGLEPDATPELSYLTAYDQRKGLGAWTGRLYTATDARGNVTNSEIGQGYRDPDATDWVSVTIGGLTARRSPWACS